MTKKIMAIGILVGILCISSRTSFADPDTQAFGAQVLNELKAKIGDLTVDNTILRLQLDNKNAELKVMQKQLEEKSKGK